jgi:hypothetical protein
MFIVAVLAIGAAAIREASSPAIVMKNRPVNVANTEASPPSEVMKHSPVNIATTGASSSADVAKRKPVQTAKAVAQKQEHCHKNGTQKAKGQGRNANSVTGKISSIQTFMLCKNFGIKIYGICSNHFPIVDKLELYYHSVHIIHCVGTKTVIYLIGTIAITVFYLYMFSGFHSGCYSDYSLFCFISCVVKY